MVKRAKMIVCWLGVLNLLWFLGWDVTFIGLTENREFGGVVMYSQVDFCIFGNGIKAELNWEDNLCVYFGSNKRNYNITKFLQIISFSTDI